jgi:hypothetical protein
MSLMRRRSGCRPGRSEILQRAIKIFDIELDRMPCRKRQIDETTGSVRFLERDGQQIQDDAGIGLAEALALRADHMLEMQSGAAALGSRGLLPGKAVGNQRELPFLVRVLDIAHPNQRVLHVSRDDFEVAAVLRPEFQQALPRQTLHIGTASRQLFFERLKAAIEVINPVQHRFAFRSECRDHQGNRSTQIRRHDVGTR